VFARYFYCNDQLKLLAIFELLIKNQIIIGVLFFF